MVRLFRRKPESPESADVSPAPKAVGDAVERTRRTWFSRIGGLFQRGLGDDVWDELEETLIAADTGAETAFRILDDVKGRVQRESIRDPDAALAVLKEGLIAILAAPPARGKLWVPDGSSFDKLTLRPGSLAGQAGQALRQAQGERVEGKPALSEARSEQSGRIEGPAIVLVIGVNGTGKTTSIAKLAHAYRRQGKRVVLAAGDTFRAAAIDQLKQWGELVGAEVIGHKQGADPGAVVFDALTAAEKREADVVIIDTAGRLHTKVNLMEELRKVNRVIQRKFPDAPHEVLLVLDATTGQNALPQAKYFTEAVGVTGVLLAKLDGSAKGGVIFAVCDQLKLPVRFIGTGEKAEDLAPFEPAEFVEALLA
ncbi:MAG: signal recognition particle-docking protein FtsY [Chloroflexi bacterium]|nr:signal recognition particle-docking protein FtsY [Chloroflexota bacterium]